MKTEKKRSENKERKSNELKLLGTIYTQITGIQYYDTPCSANESVFFERNPYNEFDENAVEVHNESGIIGHLKRNYASWITPLLDAGLIFLKGKIAEEGDQWQIPVKIDINITEKGKKITLPHTCSTAERVIHNHILDIWKNSDKLTAETIRELRRYYYGIIRSPEILPETKLLHKILKYKIHDPGHTTTCFSEIASEFFSKIKLGKAQKYQSLTLIPLKIENPAKKSAYITGKHAIKNGNLTVEELSSSGTVSRLLAFNSGKQPVILISGEGLKGAKQDRIVNVSIVVSPGKRVEVPVSCIERGRWSHGKCGKFTSANFATDKIRKSVMNNVIDTCISGYIKYDSDQSEVWETVTESMSHLNINSYSENLNDVYKQLNISEAAEEIEYEKNTVGVAVAAPDGQLTVEIFEHPSLMKEYWKDILGSMLIDSFIEYNHTQKTKSPGVRTIHKKIKQFFKETADNAQPPAKSPGSGEFIISKTPHSSSGTLMDSGRILHVSGSVK